MTAQRTTKQQILDAIVDLHNAALIASMRTRIGRLEAQLRAKHAEERQTNPLGDGAVTGWGRWLANLTARRRPSDSSPSPSLMASSSDSMRMCRW